MKSQQIALNRRAQRRLQLSAPSSTRKRLMIRQSFKSKDKPSLNNNCFFVSEKNNEFLNKKWNKKFYNDNKCLYENNINFHT